MTYMSKLDNLSEVSYGPNAWEADRVVDLAASASVPTPKYRDVVHRQYTRFGCVRTGFNSRHPDKDIDVEI